jgi:hypothetical protein
VTAFRSTQKRTCFTVGCDFVQTRKKARWRGRLRSISRPASRFASAGRRAGISICTASGGRRLGARAWASCGAGEVLQRSQTTTKNQVDVFFVKGTFRCNKKQARVSLVSRRIASYRVVSCDSQ